MENEIIPEDLPVSSTPTPENNGLPPKKKIIRRVKPAVEGINSPSSSINTVFVKPGLTQQEKELISDPDATTPPAPPTGGKPKIITPSMAARAASQAESHGLRNFFILVVVLIIAGGAGFYVTGGRNSAWYKQVFRSGSVSPAPAPVQNTIGQNPIPTPVPVVEVPVATTSTSTMANVTSVKVNNTPTGYLNVRSIPSTGGTLITQIHPGETYPYTKTQSGWYNITLDNGQIGWVTGQYVTVVKK